MNDNKEYLVDYYYEKKLQGKDFTEIRKELSMKNIDSATITEIINIIDNRVLNNELKKNRKHQNDELKIIGFILMIGGGVITLGTFFRIINLEGRFIIAYGPIIGGYAMILSSRIKEKRNPQKMTRSRYFKK